MCHAWITHGIVSGYVLVMDILSCSRGEQQKFWYFTYFWEAHHAWNTHNIVNRGVLAMDRPHYKWNYLSCATELCATDRHGEINLAESVLARSSQIPGNLARLTNVGLHSSISTLVVHTHQVPLATRQVLLAKSKE